MELIQQYRFEGYDSQVWLCQLEEAFAGIDLLVVDEHTRPFVPAGVPCVELPAGEQHKNMEQLQRVLQACVQQRLTRRSCLAALGGGVLCDLTALAASLYMRGCRLVLLPSTLLAMVDAALGGKTGVDFQGYKNLVGSFYPAQELRVIPSLLQRLAARDYRSGLAEVLKHGLLAGGELYQLLQQQRQLLLEREPVLLKQVLLLAMDVKAQIVARDLYERGERAHLNLGHTFAHALETVSHFAMTHGEAVAWGLMQANRLAQRLGLCTPDYAQQVEQLVSSYGFSSHFCYPWVEVVAAMSYDKKRQQSGVLSLVLQRGLAQTQLCELEAGRLLTLLES